MYVQVLSNAAMSLVACQGGSLSEDVLMWDRTDPVGFDVVFAIGVEVPSTEAL